MSGAYKRSFAVAFFVAIGLTCAAGLSGQPKSNASPEADQELLKARKANEEAQAEYYREQTRILRTPTPAPNSTPARTFRQNIADNPASVIGIIGTILAALFAATVGFITLAVN